MRRRFPPLIVVMLAIAGFPADAQAAPPAPDFSVIGRYETGLITDLGDDTAAETVAFSGNRMFVSNATDTSVDIVDLSDPTRP